jgi:hypothetical protein
LSGSFGIWAPVTPRPPPSFVTLIILTVTPFATFLPLASTHAYPIQSHAQSTPIGSNFMIRATGPLLEKSIGMALMLWLSQGEHRYCLQRRSLKPHAAMPNTRRGAQLVLFTLCICLETTRPQLTFSTVSPGWKPENSRQVHLVGKTTQSVT